MLPQRKYQHYRKDFSSTVLEEKQERLLDGLLCKALKINLLG